MTPGFRGRTGPLKVRRFLARDPATRTCKPPHSPTWPPRRRAGIMLPGCSGGPIDAHGSWCTSARPAPPTRGDHGARLHSPPHRRARIIVHVCAARPIDAPGSWCMSARPAPSTRRDHGACLHSPPHRRAGIMLRVCTARPIDALRSSCVPAWSAPPTARDVAARTIRQPCGAGEGVHACSADSIATKILGFHG